MTKNKFQLRLKAEAQHAFDWKKENMGKKITIELYEGEITMLCNYLQACYEYIEPINLPHGRASTLRLIDSLQDEYDKWRNINHVD